MLLRKGLKIAHLRLFALLAETGQVGAAAEAMGMTQPAASRLLSEAEGIAGTPLHLRTGRGIALTPAGAALARRAARVLIEVEDAGRELDEIAEGRAGLVRLGAVTGPALELVLPALADAQRELPGLRVEVVVGPSDVLTDGLLSGRLDFALARLPEDGGNGGAGPLLFQPVGTEPVALVVRRGHPLAGVSKVPPGALMHYDWVMPGPDAILRRSVVARLRALGLPDPPGRVATASFLLTFAILDGSDAIAPLARAVANRFAGRPDAPFAALCEDLAIEVPAFGMLTRAGAGLTPSAGRLQAMILDHAAARSA
ncbi:MAG: LysR family transcriptional regulator [Paracoccaceae bacterium]|nr:MAG: LysR family transcriptional regulator [Paracoccaceae bacterium]